MKRLIRLLQLVGVCLLASCFNPQVVNNAVGGLYPTAPGNNPFVLATIVNDTTASLTGTITVDEGRLTPRTYTFTTLDPGTRTAGVLIPWPFLRLTIGDLANPFAPSIACTLPSGLTVQVPFGQTPLIAGQDVARGDTIIFDMVADARDPSAIRVSTSRILAETQTGPFSQADTFTTARLLLLQSGLGGLVGGAPTALQQ
jgi:hypothetical protein